MEAEPGRSPISRGGPPTFRWRKWSHCRWGSPGLASLIGNSLGRAPFDLLDDGLHAPVTSAVLELLVFQVRLHDCQASWRAHFFRICLPHPLYESSSAHLH